jgi:hypothetical protein
VLASELVGIYAHDRKFECVTYQPALEAFCSDLWMELKSYRIAPI